MSAPQTAQLIPLDIPVGGFNARDSLARMNPVYTPYLVNAETNGQSIKVRAGVSVMHKSSSITTAPQKHLFAFNGGLYLVAVDAGTGTDTIYRVTNDTVTSRQSLAGVSFNKHHSFEHGGYCYVMRSQGSTTNSKYSSDGTTWTDWPFTYDDGGGADPQTGRCGCSYKGRAYLFQDQKLYYGDISAIAGALTQVDLSTIITDKGSICWCKVVSSPGQRADEQMLCFGTHTGGIYVYAGDNPGANSWTIVGRFKTSPPLYTQQDCSIEINNDVWVLGESGIVSIRMLFQNGSSRSQDYTISGPINRYLQEYIRIGNKAVANAIPSLSRTGIFGNCAYDENKQKVYFMLEGYVDPITLGNFDMYNWEQPSNFFKGTTLLSYDLNTQGWAVLIIPSATTLVNTETFGLTYVKGSLYYIVSTSIMKFGPGNLTPANWGDEEYRDEVYGNPGTYQDIDYYIHGAYSDLGVASENKRVCGYEYVFKTDFDSDEVTSRAAADFNKAYSTTASEIPFVTSFYDNVIAYYPCGVKGDFTQWRLEGAVNSDSATVGLELFSVAACVL